MRRALYAAAAVVGLFVGLVAVQTYAAEPVNPQCVEAVAGDGWYAVARSIAPDWYATATQGQRDAFAGYLAAANGVNGTKASLYVGQIVCYNPAKVPTSSSTTTSSTSSTTATTLPETTTTVAPTTVPPATTVPPPSTSTSSSTTAPSTTSTVPSSTGFPDASNTGVPAGVALTTYTGPSNVTVANTLIVGKRIGCLQISAANVVIRNSLISCNGWGGVLLYDDAATAAGRYSLLIEDSEIDCRLSPGSSGIAEAYVVARRVDIHGCENGLSINRDVTIEDSYIHDLYNGGTAHMDGIQFAFGHWTGGTTYVCCTVNVTIRHNTIYAVGPDGSLGSSTVTSSKLGSDVNVLIDGNVLAGGSYTLYCVQGFTGVNYRVTDNRFSTRFSPKFGAFGPSTDCGDETQSGNVVHETGQPLHLG